MVAEDTILVGLESDSLNQVNLMVYGRSWAIRTVGILEILACYFLQCIVYGSCMQCRNKSYFHNKCLDVFVHLTLISYHSHEHNCKDVPFSRIVIFVKCFCHLSSIFVVFVKHDVYEGTVVRFLPYRSVVPPWWAVLVAVAAAP